MNNSEKWERLKNPTCREDYGLSITLGELDEVIASKKHLDKDDVMAIGISSMVDDV